LISPLPPQALSPHFSSIGGCPAVCLSGPVPSPPYILFLKNSVERPVLFLFPLGRVALFDPRFDRVLLGPRFRTSPPHQKPHGWTIVRFFYNSFSYWRSFPPLYLFSRRSPFPFNFGPLHAMRPIPDLFFFFRFFPPPFFNRESLCQAVPAFCRFSLSVSFPGRFAFSLTDSRGTSDIREVPSPWSSSLNVAGVLLGIPAP